MISSGELGRRHVPCAGVDLADYDLTDEAQVRACFARYQPDALVHCAAYTQVDRAEDEQEACYAANVTAVSHLASACRRADIPMMFFSTDYVFPGDGETPMRWTIRAIGQLLWANQEACRGLRSLAAQIFYPAHLLGVWGEQAQFCQRCCVWRRITIG